MDVFEAIYKRRSIRRYKRSSIDKTSLEKIVDAGRFAPTARGEEGWEFIVVTDKNRLERIGNMTDYGRFICDSAACIAIVCKDTKYYLEDGCAATENMLLAATALGIGACWVAGDKKPYANAILKELDVPSNFKLVCLIALGLPDEEPHPRRRRSLDEVLHWESF